MSTVERSAHSAYPPQALHDYAFLADGERGALVGPRGEICWLCAPRWDSDAVFSSLIGGGGLYAVTPKGPFVPGGHYEEGSLIWRSRWVTETGIVECREALALPGDARRLVLLRRVLARDAAAQVRVVLHPLAGYGSEPVREARRDEHYRFRHDEWPLEDAEGAFLLCGFVMALAEHHQGREVEAYRWFERNRHACGRAGLYSEEYDIAQRQLRGNLPQAFVHALMRETAVSLARGTPT